MAYNIGDRAGDYEIVDVLGAGGMGKVYKVRNLISDRIEAMKVLLPNLQSDPELADRFIREIKVQASLDHPNIAGLHTALRLNNQLVMLIEFVAGRTVEEELRNGPVPVSKAVEYISQVLTALSYSHARGIVHRDIKPANMMLTADGTVKLMDFGIARITADRKLTQTGRTVGSLYYMSPEQIQGVENLDGRSDLYSVGVSLYEMCTNRRPFQGDSDYSIMAAHLNSAPVPPIQLDPSLPAALNDIILMSIAKDPGQRFQTADAFQAALATVAAAPGPAAVPLRNPPPAPAQPASKRGLYMAIGSVVTIAVLAIAAIQAPKFFDSSSASDSTVAEPLPRSSAPEPVAPPVADAPQQPAQTELNVQASPPLQTQPSQTRPTQGRPFQAPPAQSTISQPAPVTVPQQPQQQTQIPTQTPPAQAPVQTPTTPAVDNKELDDLRERMMLVATRANSIRGSLNSMRKQMGSLNLNADFTTREQRMEAYLDEAEGALKAGESAKGKKNLDSAERVIEELEKRLGR
jgi:eukaryotic-like serine/threonine-protein kinase